MIHSLYQIDFIDATSGGATRLLSVGDMLENPLQLSFEQGALDYAPIGAEWGKTLANGSARRPLEWARLEEHASHEAAAGHCIRHAASLPFMRPGKIRLTVSGGETWDMLDAVLLAAVTRPHLMGRFRTLSTYRASSGRTVPVSGVPHYAGMPTSWILTAHDDQTRLHSAM